MPRKKAQGVQLQRKFPAKPSSCVQFKKTALDAKTEVSPQNILLPMPLIADTIDTTDSANTNYLHKKFKKGTNVSVLPKTESYLPNGISDNLKPVNGILPPTEASELQNGVIHPERRSPNGFHSVNASSEETTPEEEHVAAQPGRYVCPFCQMVCAKPSVLQKHLRAHTNERPYPCASCGFAFKTKSNLYKHCRSQAHRAKSAMGGLWESCESGDSDASDESLEIENVKSRDSQPRIYKPKFHKAAFYNDDVPSTHNGEMSPNYKFPSPSEQLEERISKIIRDNQLIFDTMEPQFSKKFLQRQNSREKESSSPKSEVDAKRNSETKSKLALALMKVDRNERSYSPSYPPVNSENNTYQPLNLTVRPLGPALPFPEFSSSPDIKCDRPSVVATLRLQSEFDTDIGPLLGSTPLIEGPNTKKRRVQSTTVPPDPRELAEFASRRLSTSSLPSTLKSLEELSRHPMKPPCMNMFGGEVKIMECSEKKAVRLSVLPDVRISEDSRVMTVAKAGLFTSGGTLVSPGGGAFHIANILNTDTTSLTLAPNVVTPNLAVPGVPQPECSVGVITIMHGEKAIPFVPGMPGPQSLLPESPRRPKLSVSSLPIKPSSSFIKISLPNDVPKIEISSPPVEEKQPTVQKFLRPTSLPLKPGSFTPKRLHQGTTPTVLSLVSPETPRQKKSYGQLFLNGHAYTYLGMKCSTRSYYCTISRPQPMYVERSSQLPRLSMYSNWKVYSEIDTIGVTPGQAMAQYDSRYKTGGYTTADSRRQLNSTSTVTHSSTWTFNKSEPSVQETRDGEPEKKRLRVCNGGYESREKYTYVRGRGRGRYVCEECGIRCKKPSMLKKHIKTHTDVRPYTCRHCSFAFKTKGNLTKHMKSKSHFKRCSELGVDPTPPVLSDTESDRHDDTGSSGDDESDEEFDDESNAGTDAQEREAACSLLSLSASPRVSQHVAAGLLPRAVHDTGPVCYPYTAVLQNNVLVQTEVHPPYRDRVDSPMDLSQKEPSDFLSKDSEFLLPVTEEPKTTREVVRPVPAYLAASIANIEQHQVVDPPGGHMLQAYLTAKALRDVQIKQQHRSRSRTPETISEPSTPTASAPINVLTSSPLRLIESPGVHKAAEPPERILVVGDPADGAKRVIVSIPCSTFHTASSSDQRAPVALSKPHDGNLKAEFFPPASGPNHSYVSVTEDGRSICVICNKTFNKPSQLRLHVNIHYFERPFRCEACAVSFRTKGHLQKHERSSSHHNKVSMNTTFGAATTTNPRPFKCDDCKIAFRIHGHLAKHLRSKMHIMKLECLGKLPFGTYADLERSGFNLNEIDTTDCDISLESLLALSKKLDSSNSNCLERPRPLDDCGAESDGSSSEGLHTEHFQCGMCGEVSDSSAALQVHMFAEHGKDSVLDKRKLED